MTPPSTAERRLCARDDTLERDAPPVLLTRPGRGCVKPPCVYVCVSQCRLLQPQVVYVRLLMHSAAINVARGGEKKKLCTSMHLFGFFRTSDSLFVSRRPRVRTRFVFNRTVRRFSFRVCPASNHLTSSLCCGLPRRQA